MVNWPGAVQTFELHAISQFPPKKQSRFPFGVKWSRVEIFDPYQGAKWYFISLICIPMMPLIERKRTSFPPIPKGGDWICPFDVFVGKGPVIMAQPSLEENGRCHTRKGSNE